MRKNLEDIQAISREIKENWRELLQSSIPRILIHILPIFAANKCASPTDSKEARKRVGQATASYDMLNKVVTEEMIEASIVNNLETLVVDILMTLHDNSTVGTESARYIRYITSLCIYQLISQL